MSNVIFWFCLLITVTFVGGNLYWDTLMDTITHVLNFTLQHNELLDVNMLFGVAIVAGQLQIINSYNISGEIKPKVLQLRQLCNEIFDIAFSRNIADINHDSTQIVCLSPAIWTFDNPPSRLTIPTGFTSSRTSRTQSADLENKFRPRYEYCLRILIENCYIPRSCFNLIITYKNTGYILSHQILYLHVVKQLISKNLCRISFALLSVKDVDIFINEKCYDVFSEINDLQFKGDLNETSIDLILEEVVVCGLQNYIDFFSPNFVRMILDYKLPTSYDRMKSREPLLTSSDVHLMSVRVAALILYLKQDIQNSFSND